MKLLNLGFRTKITLLVGLGVLLSVVFISMVFIASLRESLRLEFESKGIAMAESLSSSVQDTLLNRDASTIQGFIDQYLKINGVNFVFVADEKNNIIAHTFSPTIPNRYQHLPSLDPEQTGAILEKAHVGNRNILEIQHPILSGLLGRAVIGMDLDSIEDEVIVPLEKQVLIYMILLFLFVCGTVLFILKRILHPVQQLTAAARQVSSEKKFDHAKLRETGDEIGELARAFNLMIAEIKKHTESLEEQVDSRTKELLELAQNLEKENAERRQMEKKLEQQNHFKTGLNQLAIAMQGKQDVGELCGSVLETLLSFLGLQMGAIFVNLPNGQVKRVADIGYPPRHDYPDTFPLGSDQVGQVAQSGKPVLMDDLEKMPFLTFGFGEIIANSVFIHPLVFDEAIVGVLELVSRWKLSDAQTKWVEEASGIIALGLRSQLQKAKV